MTRIGGGPKRPTPSVSESDKEGISGDVSAEEEAPDLPEDISEGMSGRASGALVAEGGVADPSSTSLLSGINPDTHRWEGESDTRELSEVNLGRTTMKGPAFEMVPSAPVGDASRVPDPDFRGVEISAAESGVVEITEGETFGDPFDQRWEMVHPGSLKGLTARSPASAFEGPPLTGDPIRMRFRLKEPEPGRTFNVRVPGPELSLRHALNAQCKNAAKIMDRLGDSGLGRFDKVQLEADGQMNVQKPHFKEGEEFNQVFGETAAERLEFRPNQDAVLVRLDGSEDKSHLDYFRNRAFDPRIRTEPSPGTPSENEAEALTKSIRKAVEHGNLELTEGSVSRSESAAPSASSASSASSAPSVAPEAPKADPGPAVLALGELPVIPHREYRAEAAPLLGRLDPGSKEASLLEEIVSFFEEDGPALEATRDDLEAKQGALRSRLESGPVDGELESECREFLAARETLDDEIEDLRRSGEEFDAFLTRTVAELKEGDPLPGAERLDPAEDRDSVRSSESGESISTDAALGDLADLDALADGEDPENP